MITEENGNQIYDNEKLSPDHFYDLLDHQALKTSQTILGDMIKMWDKLLDHYDQVIFAGLSKGLSGQFNTYRMLSETDNKYKGKVFVVDTNGVSVILQHEIRDIAMWISENKTGFEIMELMVKEHDKFACVIIPKNLETLKRGGRITPGAAALAKLLKITPILRYNGIIDKEGKARTFKKAVLEGLSLIKKECKGIQKIDISYSRSEPETLQLIKSLIAKEGLEINLEAELPNVVSAHTGRETLALIGWKVKGKK
jgi:DegV family protein with EDD domain